VLTDPFSFFHQVLAAGLHIGKNQDDGGFLTVIGVTLQREVSASLLGQEGLYIKRHCSDIVQGRQIRTEFNIPKLSVSSVLKRGTYQGICDSHRGGGCERA
jgi:hypothetical protein